MASGLHEDAQTRFGGHRHLPGLARLGIPGFRDERMARIVGYCNLQVLDESY
jgi:hypothetical protein